jgi:hypothetical protein|tara:strand:- start:887 stop:1252 length:366 start_codon:yes stop_codon:yes gene_type:complete
MVDKVEQVVDRLQKDLLSREESWELINDWNEEAHQEVWDLWDQASELEDNAETDEELDKAEELKEQASDEQQQVFRDTFFTATQKQKDSVWHYVKYDEDFKFEFEQWYGKTTVTEGENNAK